MFSFNICWGLGIGAKLAFTSLEVALLHQDLNSNHQLSGSFLCLWPVTQQNPSTLQAQASVAQGCQHIEQTPQVSPRSELAAEPPAHSCSSEFWFGGTPDAIPNAKPHSLATFVGLGRYRGSYLPGHFSTVAQGCPWSCVPSGTDSILIL